MIDCHFTHLIITTNLVKDYIIHRQWNLDKLNNVLPHDIVKKITSIHLPYYDYQDDFI